MDRRGLRVFVLALVLANVAALSWWLSRSEEAADRPRNVLLVAIDLLDAGSVWPRARHDTTPHLRHLMLEGTSFTQARAQSNLTAACSRVLLRGRSLSRQADGPSLATLLARQGYDTAGFASSFFCDDPSIADGFQAYTCPSAAEGGRAGSDTVDQASAWIAARGERPWFCWVMLWDLHMSPVGRPLARNRRQRLDETIAYEDACVGRLLDTLRAAGRDDDTLVVVVGLHGVMEISNPLSDKLLRVPWVMRAPIGVPAARRVDAPVAQVDVVPTILGVLGVDGYRGDGVDVIAAAPPQRREIYVETENGEATAVVRDGWKYVAYRQNLDLPLRRYEPPDGPPDPARPGWSIIAYGGRRDLFDLRADPLEQTSVGDAFPQMADDLARRLAAWQGGARAASTAPLSPALEKALRSHGYLPAP